MKTLSASQHPVSSKTINLGKIIICVALLFLTYPDTDVTAQPGPKYATGLNILMATDGIGSSNYEGLYFYTNNLKRGSILKDGAFDYLTRSYFHSNVYCDSLVTAWQLQAQVIQVVSALITGNAQVDGILTIGTLSLSGSGSSSGSIISSTGAIDFGNNNLSTTGNITAGGKISAASATITDSLATGNLSADNGYVETLNADNGNIETLHAASLHATSLHSDTFSVTGTSTFSSLTDTTNGIAVINKYGSLQRLNFSDNNSDVLFGNGTFGSLGTATGWQWYDTTVLLSTAPVVAVQNNLVVGGRVSIGAIRMSNGTGTDSMRTAQNFAIEARKIFFEADTVNIRRRIEAKQIAVDTLTATGIAAGSMTASNMAAPVGRIDTLISDRMRTAQLTVSGDIEALNGTVRSNEVSATKIQSALVQTDSLDVNGSIHIKDSIKIGNSIWLAGKGADPSIHNSIYSTNGPLIIQSNNNFGNNVIINAYNHSGKVGIGTIDPQKMLHVKTNHSVIGQEDPSGGSSHYGIRLEDIGMNMSKSIWDIEPVATDTSKFTIGTPGKIRFCLVENGFAGLNTMSPQYDFHIHSDTLVNWTTYVSPFGGVDPPPPGTPPPVGLTMMQITNKSTGTTAGDGFLIGTFNKETFFINQEFGNMKFATNDSTRMIITKEGWVGIGTKTPGEKLEVNGNINAANYYKNGQLMLFSQWSDVGNGDIYYDGGNVGIGTNTPGAKFEVNNGDILLKASASDPGDLIFQTSAGSQKARVWSEPSGASGLYLSSADNIADLSIGNNGNVGIGTTNPQAKLQVGGSSNTSNDGLYVNNSSNTTGGFYYGGNANGLVIGNYAAAPWPGTNGLFVGGKVLIGTSGNNGAHADALLQVGGKILAQSYKATINNWGDYVLKSGHKKMSLFELEAYIKRYGHLPGSPSEEEIIENGLDLPETAKQQHIILEENILNDIEQQKEIETLKEENKQLRKENKEITHEIRELKKLLESLFRTGR